MKPAPSTVLDAASVSLSGLCLLHCLALPLLAAASPLMASWAEAEWVHSAAVMLAAPLSAAALWRRRRLLHIAGPALLGLGLLALGATHLPSHDLETPVTVAGGLLLAGAHLSNWRERHARANLPARCAEH